MTRSYLSFSAAVILQALASGYRYGFDIMEATGLPSGTVYPALRRLERQRFISASWEPHHIAQRELRPPRRYYEVTTVGGKALGEAVKRYRLLAPPHSRVGALRPAHERG
jgi:PadR family transcriptional regulator